MKILNFGSLNIDKTYSLQTIVEPGETVNSLKYEEFIGGKGLNQSIALASAGARVFHAGLVGARDGGPLVKALEARGVDTSLIETRDQASGHAVIQVDEAGMNCIIVEGGTNQLVDQAYVDRVLENFTKGDMLVLQNEISNLAYIVDKAYEKEMIICLNPSPMDARVWALDLNKISYFLVNEIEAGLISAKEDRDEVLEEILTKFPDSKLVMTLGDQGAIYKDRDQSFLVGGHKVDVVDTTGAGDTFCGYFLASLAASRPLNEAMTLANKAAALACTKKGASNSIPLLADILSKEEER